jgi:hypothetical protein
MGRVTQRDLRHHVVDSLTELLGYFNVDKIVSINPFYKRKSILFQRLTLIKVLKSYLKKNLLSSPLKMYLVQ